MSNVIINLKHFKKKSETINMNNSLKYKTIHIYIYIMERVINFHKEIDLIMIVEM